MRNILIRLVVVFFLELSPELGATRYNFVATNSAPTASKSFGSPEAIFLNIALSIDDSGVQSSFTGYVHSNENISATGAGLRVNSIGRIMGTITEALVEYAIVIKNDLLCGPRFRWSGGYLQLYAQDANPATVQLSGDLRINQGVTNQELRINDSASTPITIDGNGNTLFLGNNALKIFSPLVLRNMNIVINGTNPFQFNASALLTLQDVNIFIDPVMAGSSLPLFLNDMPVIIKGMVTISGQGQVVDLNTNSIGSTNSSAIYIDDNATLKVNQGVTLKVSPDIATINKKIYLKGACSTLHLNGCSLWIPVAGITTPGLQLERGMVIFEDRVVINNEGNANASKGLILGDGSSASNDVKLSIDGDAQVIVDGFLFHRPA